MTDIIKRFEECKNLSERNAFFNKIKDNYSPDDINDLQELINILDITAEVYLSNYMKNATHMQNVCALYAKSLMEQNIENKKFSDHYDNDEFIKSILKITEEVLDFSYQYTYKVQIMKQLIESEKISQQNKMHMMENLLVSSTEPETRKALGDDYYKYIKYFPDLEKMLSEWWGEK